MTARLLKHVRSQIFEMDGQQKPWSLALSASDMSTDFGVGGIWRGQHWPISDVLTVPATTS